MPLSEIEAVSRMYFQADGMANLEARTVSLADQDAVRFRGRKTVSDVPATYEMVVAARDHYLIALMVGGPSATYPEAGYEAFLTSIVPIR